MTPVAQPATILLVDDDEAVLRTVVRMLRAMNHAVVAASNASEALAAATERLPSLVLLDFQMSGMNGASLFGAFRASLGDRCPPVVFVSSTSPEEIARHLDPDCRPVAYLPKPFSSDELRAVVREALGRVVPL